MVVKKRVEFVRNDKVRAEYKRLAAKIPGLTHRDIYCAGLQYLGEKIEEDAKNDR